jgi:hypothetical protein
MRAAQMSGPTNRTNRSIGDRAVTGKSRLDCLRFSADRVRVINHEYAMAHALSMKLGNTEM